MDCVTGEHDAFDFDARPNRLSSNLWDSAQKDANRWFRSASWLIGSIRQLALHNKKLPKALHPTVRFALQIYVKKTPDGLRAIGPDGRPIEPDDVVQYLRRKFGDKLELVKSERALQ